MQVYGLVGNPVGHSLSPPMHEAAYEETGLDARYVTFEPARDDIAAAVEGADALGVSGLNVTIPFKQDVLELVDPDPLAERIGAVNTVDFGGETPKGYNTDAAGVTRSFERHGVGLAGNSAVVVGAGGAGRAAAFALSDADASVHVANRTAETAVELAEAVPGATGGGLDTLDRIREADVLVNATSVGMESPDETPVPAEYLHGDLAVLDAVYTPLETQLIRDAAAAGAVTIDGAWMLLLQGVEAFERWTGRDAPVDAMNAALRSHLESD
ncbi:shikimate dehydrogenase [Haloferax sp. Atlit-10N]|uniref:Shikimate dehydrogenase (NADP(+)) n=1 Tax=Haloferax prahovense (strain DSM 18310 / JCM 13924 / TL6) TaxID=1227461 RepID=M0GLH3_HALPT|nr:MULTISPECIES: shikimate dehydrogenase [Haloferax]ELZ73045.1 shikimate 5-dehydrogenase [Haloferax prahovense DSM 18310]RDZ43626.1 shikimate dehydrogenase [Haloferax sp. Atlit-19N]RDZ46477.1 shikimate dehydrogenase [Haloferax sp. Atlit-16N]RDZ60310.1 shikimate dehydrogenase [Haloferax sp. Atlit-10N]